MDALKASIKALVNSFHLYDYVLIGASAGLFLLLLLLAIVLRHKTLTSLLLIIFSFIVIAVGPVIGYKFVHGTIYKHSITDMLIKPLAFSEAILIKGTLTNQGRQTFNSCQINAKAYRGADNFLEELVYPLKPFLETSIVTEDALDVNSSMDFKILLEPFTYAKEYNISVKANCQ